jgi:hypothetical protein
MGDGQPSDDDRMQIDIWHDTFEYVFSQDKNDVIRFDVTYRGQHADLDLVYLPGECASLHGRKSRDRACLPESDAYKNPLKTCSWEWPRPVSPKMSIQARTMQQRCSSVGSAAACSNIPIANIRNDGMRRTLFYSLE